MESAKAPWEISVQFLKGVGEKLGQSLAKVEVKSFWDLLFHLPRTYEDRRQLAGYKELLQCLENETPALGQAIIESYAHRRAGRARSWLEATARILEPSGQQTSPRFIHFVWFHESRFIEKSYPIGTSILFQGRIQAFRGQLQIAHPQFQKTESELAPWEYGRFVPVYPESMGISTRVFRKILYQALLRPELSLLRETLPERVQASLGLPPIAEALREMHFPEKWIPDLSNPEDLYGEGNLFYRRLAFEELFYLSLALSLRNRSKLVEEEKKAVTLAGIPSSAENLARLKAQLPFTLTAAQSTATDEILADLQSSQKAMHRLLQGDVGSGKTIVAFLAMIHAHQAGRTSVLMAPTELLAEQHYRNFQKLYPQFAADVVLLKGSMTEKEKREQREFLKAGTARIAIGTQALLFSESYLHNVALVVIDEQHRFGVKQRLALKKINPDNLVPHLLVMTATPIPRSLALTLYGDLQLSKINQKPVGRIAIKTHIVRERARAALVARLKSLLQEGRQIYLVYPLIEENEELELKDVKRAFKEWTEAFPDHKVVLLHGQMKPAEKDKAMASFAKGEAHVLVATTVIEVGIDVPNASVMVIEHAERFGLSQLHQLRGRVGRGSVESICVLLASNWLNERAFERLKIMEESDDGFVIAEKDLELRGPGEFLGQRQSGLPQFRVAHLLRDTDILEAARVEANHVLSEDPDLKLPHNRNTRLHLMRWWGDRFELSLSG
jgi:ATP-dependent DNA helicase RecG